MVHLERLLTSLLSTYRRDMAKLPGFQIATLLLTVITLHVENVNPFEKLLVESKFQSLSTWRDSLHRNCKLRK